jgi:hypothetical protein
MWLQQLAEYLICPSLGRFVHNPSAVRDIRDEAAQCLGLESALLPEPVGGRA